MKRTMIGLALMAMASQAAAVEATTRDGFPACRTAQYMEDFIGFMMEKDTQSMRQYMIMDQCFTLTGGLKVEAPSPLSMEKVVSFTHHGKKYWTIHLSIRY